MKNKPSKIIHYNLSDKIIEIIETIIQRSKYIRPKTERRTECIINNSAYYQTVIVSVAPFEVEEMGFTYTMYYKMGYNSNAWLIKKHRDKIIATYNFKIHNTKNLMNGGTWNIICDRNIGIATLHDTVIQLYFSKKTYTAYNCKFYPYLNKLINDLNIEVISELINKIQQIRMDIIFDLNDSMNRPEFDVKFTYMTYKIQIKDIVFYIYFIDIDCKIHTFIMRGGLIISLIVEVYGATLFHECVNPMIDGIHYMHRVDYTEKKIDTYYGEKITISEDKDEDEEEEDSD